MFIKTQYGYLNLDTVVFFERNSAKTLWRLYLPFSSGFYSTPESIWIEDEESLEIINDYLISKGVVE